MWYIIFPYAVLPSLPYIIHRFNEFGEPISYDTPLRSLYHTICYTVTCLPGHWGRWRAATHTVFAGGKDVGIGVVVVRKSALVTRGEGQ
jgi:hypothetical protein